MWVQQQPYNVKIPSNLKPGYYIVRNELWALHAGKYALEALRVVLY